MVYVEYVIINNLIANTVIIKFSARLLDKKGKRLIVAIILSTVFGTFLPTVKVSEFLCLVIKFLIALLITFCITGRERLKNFLVALFVFYCVSFCLAGATTALISTFSLLPKIIPTEELTFYILIGAFVFFVVCENVYGYVQGKTQNKLQKVFLITKEDKELEVDAFVDSGNGVTYMQKGVHFVPKSLEKIIDYRNKNEYIKVKTISGEKFFSVQIIPVLKLSNGKIFNDVPIVFWDSTDKKIILHRSIQ